MTNVAASPSPFQGEGRGEGSLHPRNLKLVGKARRLRRDMTETEKRLWYYLRSSRFEGYKFRRQYPLGNYIVDFICVQEKLIIELDGGQHLLQLKYDSIRDNWFKQQGFHILRFWNNEMMEKPVGVLQVIMEYLKCESAARDPHPGPLPGRERGRSA